MGDWHGPQGPFDIPDVPNYVPRRMKPWLFIFFVLIVQFSGGIYLAAATDMVGTTALMQEDILMAGYASLVGMSINFAVMFRLKFRFSNRIGQLVCGVVLIAANFICANTTSVPLLVATCFVAGWFRMWATFVCNSTIQFWLTPVRDMAVFFCYVYLVVNGVIQLSGIATIYTAFFSQWEYMHWIMSGLIVLMMVMVLILVKPVKGPMQIPLLGIDWIGAALWSVFMLCFALMATEHVFEHSYAAVILGFDETNLIDLNWYVFAGIIVGCMFTYFTFALHKWRYKTMTAIAFAFTAVYLGWFYFMIDYGVEKGMLFFPLFMRGFASVIISIVFLTSIVQSGLHFFVFPQALTINGFTGAVMGATLGPALIGEILRHTMAKNAAIIGARFTDFNAGTSHIPLCQLYGTVQRHALVVSMKEIYGWLLIAAILSLAIIIISYGPIRPTAIFPKWKTIRKIFRKETEMQLKGNSE